MSPSVLLHSLIDNNIVSRKAIERKKKMGTVLWQMGTVLPRGRTVPIRGRTVPICQRTVPFQLSRKAYFDFEQVTIQI